MPRHVQQVVLGMDAGDFCSSDCAIELEDCRADLGGESTAAFCPLPYLENVHDLSGPVLKRTVVCRHPGHHARAGRPDLCSHGRLRFPGRGVPRARDRCAISARAAGVADSPMPPRHVRQQLSSDAVQASSPACNRCAAPVACAPRLCQRRARTSARRSWSRSWAGAGTSLAA